MEAFKQDIAQMPQAIPSQRNSMSSMQYLWQDPPDYCDPYRLIWRIPCVDSVLTAARLHVRSSALQRLDDIHVEGDAAVGVHTQQPQGRPLEAALVPAGRRQRHGLCSAVGHCRACRTPLGSPPS